MFNKQQFEDELYNFVTARINAVYPELVKSGGDIGNFHRQFLQAVHFVVEESVVQNFCGWKLSLETKQMGGK